MKGIRIFLGGVEVSGMEYEEHKAVKIEMWYDRHRREWVLYPVDDEGNQLAEAMYGFGKKDALDTKRLLEEKYGL